jgi:hypothetical protein
MALKISQFISIFLLALVTGVFWGPWLGLSRSIATFQPEVFLAIGHRMIRNLAPVMPILMPAAMLSVDARVNLFLLRATNDFRSGFGGIGTVHRRPAHHFNCGTPHR